MPTNPKDYTNLRTLLDSLEVGALRFFLSGTGMSQPQKLRYLKERLMPIIDELWHQPQGVRRGSKTLGIETDCPPGYYDCDGCCVPYKCPDVGNTPTRKTAKATKRQR
jgi:hypothetical protein